MNIKYILLTTALLGASQIGAMESDASSQQEVLQHMEQQNASQEAMEQAKKFDIDGISKIPSSLQKVLQHMKQQNASQEAMEEARQFDIGRIVKDSCGKRYTVDSIAYVKRKTRNNPKDYSDFFWPSKDYEEYHEFFLTLLANPDYCTWLFSYDFPQNNYKPEQ